MEGWFAASKTVRTRRGRTGSKLVERLELKKIDLLVAAYRHGAHDPQLIDPPEMIDDRFTIIGHRGTFDTAKRHGFQGSDRPPRPQPALQVGEQFSCNARLAKLVETQRKVNRYPLGIDSNQTVAA